MTAISATSALGRQPPREPELGPADADFRETLTAELDPAPARADGQPREQQAERRGTTAAGDKGVPASDASAAPATAAALASATGPNPKERDVAGEGAITNAQTPPPRETGHTSAPLSSDSRGMTVPGGTQATRDGSAPEAPDPTNAPAPPDGPADATAMPAGASSSDATFAASKNAAAPQPSAACGQAPSAAGKTAAVSLPGAACSPALAAAGKGDADSSSAARDGASGAAKKPAATPTDATLALVHHGGSLAVTTGTELLAPSPATALHQSGAPTPTPLPAHTSSAALPFSSATLQHVVESLMPQVPLGGAWSRTGRMTLRLDPPELGEVAIDVRVKDGGVFLRLETQAPAAAGALGGEVQALRRFLAEQGLSLTGFEVASQNGQSGRQTQDQPRPEPAGYALPARHAVSLAPKPTSPCPEGLDIVV
jgi:flagellar hook-length control protein FliK